MSEKLFQEFSPASDEAWTEKILKDLRGRSIEDIAKHRPLEGMDIEVFYTSKDLADLPKLSLKRDWRIIENEPFEELTLDDMIYHLVRTGSWLMDEIEDVKTYLEVFTGEIGTKNLGVDGTAYHEAGASAVFELACILSHLNEYLNLLSEKNLLDDGLMQKISVKVAIGPDYFMEIAKLRALRIILSNLGQAYGLKADKGIDVYAVNSLMNYSSVDVNTNILRATTACMSAVIGGCDHLEIHPHDRLTEGIHEFGQRIARNLQLMMKHEAHLDKVLDPGAGSYYIETLTRQIGEKSWAEFKKIEADGGLIKSFRQGRIQTIIGEMARKRLEEVRLGDQVLIGINKYKLEEGGEVRLQPEHPEGEFKALRPLIIEEFL